MKRNHINSYLYSFLLFLSNSEDSCLINIIFQGIMATGAINVVRGTRSSVEELLQIYNHSERLVSQEFLIIF